MGELVSICLPTYNGEKYIREALLSAIHQTYSNIEIIISDDSSEDNTLLIVEEIMKTVNIPYMILNHSPNGIGANWNNCIKNAEGKYIKFLFQDDVLKPDCIEKMVSYMEVDTEIGLVYCKREFLYENLNVSIKDWIDTYGELHNSWDSILIKDKKPVKGVHLIKDSNFLNIPINKIGEPTAVLIKTSVFEKVGLFSEHLKQALDVEFWHRIMKCYSLNFIDEKLVFFRLHDNQASSINLRNKHDETDLFLKSTLKTLFWDLNKKNKKRYIKDYTILGHIFKKIRDLR